VTIYDNLVLYIAKHFTHRPIKRNCTLRWAAPFFHPAGCFLHKGHTKRHAECLQTLRHHLAMSNLSRACARYERALLLPRLMTMKDASIGRGHLGGRVD